MLRVDTQGVPSIVQHIYIDNGCASVLLFNGKNLKVPVIKDKDYSDIFYYTVECYVLGAWKRLNDVSI